MSNIFIGLKKDLFGCLRIEEIRDKYTETSLKEGGGIEMSTTVLPLRDARSLRFVFTYLNVAYLVSTHFYMSRRVVDPLCSTEI